MRELAEDFGKSCLLNMAEKNCSPQTAFEALDIYDLYNFKRECFQDGFISPFANDNDINSENIIIYF